jgi:hypothetical protein
VGIGVDVARSARTPLSPRIDLDGDRLVGGRAKHSGPESLGDAGHCARRVQRQHRVRIGACFDGVPPDRVHGVPDGWRPGFVVEIAVLVSRSEAIRTHVAIQQREIVPRPTMDESPARVGLRADVRLVRAINGEPERRRLRRGRLGWPTMGRGECESRPDHVRRTRAIPHGGRVGNAGNLGIRVMTIRVLDPARNLLRDRQIDARRAGRAPPIETVGRSLAANGDRQRQTRGKNERLLHDDSPRCALTRPR